MRILVISRHFLDGTSEGLCAGRTAGALTSAGHAVVVLSSVRAGEAESRVPGLDAVRIVRVANCKNRWERVWGHCNRRAGHSLPHRVVSASLNLRDFSNADEWSWVRLATEVAMGELASAEGRGEPFQVVFSRLNPAASHQVAMRVMARMKTVRIKNEAKKSGRPVLGWCAYFSDPWPHSTYPAPFQYTAGPLSRRRGLTILRRFAQRADSLLFPSQRLVNYMAQFMASKGGLKSAGGRSGLSEEHVHRKSFIAPHIGLAPDGWSREEVGRDVQRQSGTRQDPLREGGGQYGRQYGGEDGRSGNPGVSTASRNDDMGSALCIRHAGFLMGERRVTALFMALERLPPSVRAEVRVEFMGRKVAGEHTVPQGLRDTVTFLDARSPDEAAAWIREAHVALLVESDFAEGIFLPSKFAEYVSVGRPTLALSPAKGTVADYLAKPLGGGIRVGPTDVAGIAAAISELHERWKLGSLAELAPRGDLGSAFWPETVVRQVERALRCAAGD